MRGAAYVTRTRDPISTKEEALGRRYVRYLALTDAGIKTFA